MEAGVSIRIRDSGRGTGSVTVRVRVSGKCRIGKTRIRVSDDCDPILPLGSGLGLMTAWVPSRQYGVGPISAVWGKVSDHNTRKCGPVDTGPGAAANGDCEPRKGHQVGGWASQIGCIGVA